jgi:hypothetical protein
MKKRFTPIIFLVFTLLSMHMTQTIPAVTWNGSVNADVYNQDISITGTVTLIGGISVVASTQDIAVDLNGTDRIIQGESGTGAGFSRLYLYAAASQTINFNLTNNLTFQGGANTALQDLLITVSGEGEVVFTISDDKQVYFTSVADRGGTQVFVAMTNPNPNGPTLKFGRADNGNVTIKVGNKSCISYLASTVVASGNAIEVGKILFDTDASAPTGCMTLYLEADCSSVIIWGHLLNNNKSLNSKFLLSDIDLATPAGKNAIFEINGYSSLGSSLRIINDNNILPNLLIDPFCDGAFTGPQCGFVLGANGELIIDNDSYLDYIGTRTNAVPTISTPFHNLQEEVRDLIECMKITSAQELIKYRNPSAFFVDGNINSNATPAKITMNGCSAIYWRSGVDCDGEVRPDFTIDPDQETDGAGNIVFDVEGKLNVCGDPNGDNGLSVLSLQVDKTGCPVFVDGNNCSNDFPKRTFAKDHEGEYKQYNRAAWLINNRMNIYEASIVHTDQAHEVFDHVNLGRSDLGSGPTYIGGESWKVFDCPSVSTDRPTIALYNSIFRVHTNVGLTGVDVRIPNWVTNPCNPQAVGPFANTSIYRFYNNGFICDDSYGRVMIMGTDEGSLSWCGQLIDNASHLDVFQEVAQPVVCDQRLNLEVGYNDDCISECVGTRDIDGQCGVHTLYLNNASNISIGSQGAPGFTLVTTPSFCINESFYSFESAGGLWGYPEASGTTGQGGIFVDQNGTFKVAPTARASIATMVVKSGNGVINLPKNQVFFDSRVGITNWNINLTDPNQRVLVPSGVSLSDFTMDWGAVTKNYAGGFIPYVSCTPVQVCHCPVVTPANVSSLPVVEGEVDQFQIKRARIGNPASLLVDGGKIRELVFLSGYNTAEAPVGFLVVQNNAFVGIGTAHRNVDSLQASVKLGLNGLTICPDGPNGMGNSTIELNENVIIDNVCAIVPGPNFGVTTNKLTIYAQDQKEFRVKSTGTLDLSQFDTPQKQLEFAGNVLVVFEPGARLVMGGGTLIFTDNAQLTFENVLDSQLYSQSLPSNLDDIRVKFSGTGRILFNENAQMILLNQQFVGIETDPECSLITSLTLELQDQAKVFIGSESQPGGAFQVGNTTDQEGACIDFTLLINGVGARFEINRQGFVGFGVGIADKGSRFPSDWLVNCLENVNSVVIDIQEGTFDHNQIRSSAADTAALLAIGPANSYSWTFDLVDSVILGGGNLVLLDSCTFGSLPTVRDPEMQKKMNSAQEMMNEAEAIIQKAKEMMQMFTRSSNADHMNEVMDSLKDGQQLKMRAKKIMRDVISVSIHPIVTDTAGELGTYQASIMAGKLLLRDHGVLNNNPGVSVVGNIQSLIGVSSQALFNYLMTLPYASQTTPRANIFRDQVELSTVGYVFGTEIRREDIQFIVGTNGFNDVDHDHSLRIGAVGINLNDTGGNDLNNIIEIRGSDGF